MESIGSRIKAVRLSLDGGKGVSQAEFAKRLGMKQGIISIWELDRIEIGDKNIKAICYMFGISEQWIKEGAGSMKQQYSTKDEELLEKFHKLSPLAQDWLIERAEEMLKFEMFSSGQTVSNLSHLECSSNTLPEPDESPPEKGERAAG
jgi:transcriptional regulator with XRE-family HTH domain